MSPVDHISIGCDDSLLTALKAIDAGGLGLCVEVDDDRRLTGILTDGDVRRALIADADLADRAHPYVNVNPTVVSVTDDRVFALDLIQARGLTAVPVLEDGRIVAVHSLRSLTGQAPRSAIAVIMAGGRGTRLGVLTDQTPKPMLEVGGRPILERIVLQLVGDGITKIYIAVNYLADIVMEYFKTGCQYGADISYLREREDHPLGTAGALSLLPRLRQEDDQSILVLNGDLVTNSSLGALVDRHRRSDAVVTVGTTVHQHQVPFGVVDTEGDDIVGLTEKPTIRWTVSAGIHVLRPEALRFVPRNQRFDMPDLVALVSQERASVMSAPLDQPWIDVGVPTELAKARGQELSAQQ